MKLENLTNLKKRILTEANYSETFDYFFSHFGEKENFHEMGAPSSNSLLPNVLKRLGKKYFGDNVKLTDYRMTELLGHNFIHGICSIGGKLSMIIFFTDIKMGLASLSLGGAMYNFIHIKTTEIERNIDFKFLKNMNPILN